MKAKRSDFKDLLAWQYHREVIEPSIVAMEKATVEKVWPMVMTLPVQFSMDDKTSDSVTSAFKAAWASFFRLTMGSAPRINPMDSFSAVQKRAVTVFANRMVRRSINESKKLVDNVGAVNLLSLDTAINRRKDQWIESNVSLISSIPEKQFDRLESMVWAAINNGEHIGNAHGDIKGKKGLMGELLESFSISQNQAKLIARDQTLKFMSNMQKETFNEAGIEYYRWSDSSDQRVRSSHAKVDQLIFKMGEPPAVGSNGEHLEPGEDFQCRCQRIPYMPAVRGEVTMKQTGPFGSYEPVKINKAA